ncbi:hypothetical protein G1H11_22530 [Phytoactinopolyspora alkaliphila]|uniref:ARB-07466-like C-terminal domain-containing protein n=1 Tax=Phytoactinopolyspora alkaliphila TaxID=1783498 RepID=A0A6N9YTD3_9ACTN|nr:hypothetical protein [Phytoactinopolyspora alkaliphila]NED98079.1 hypothetical protein [Phytoactinopolyspora alkaliphila]
MSRAARLARTVIVLLVVGLGLAALLVWRASGPLEIGGPRERCVAGVAGHDAEVTIQQAEHAATITGVAVRRGLPARAATIALATAYQESTLYNLSYGDRDSLGLFQQRPSQGWGTPEQVQDPLYSAGAFYDALVRVDGYREMEITVAAQAVQRSAFPDAYAQHEENARALASALTGHSPAAFHCQFNTEAFDGLSVEEAGDDGLTSRALTVLEELTTVFGDLETGGYAPGGITSGHIDGSAHYDGRAIDVMLRPYDDTEVNRRGWAVAHWAVAHAHRLGIATVIYDEMIWTARRSSEGWRAYVHPSGDTENVTLRHLDHVHIDVVEGESA